MTTADTYLSAFEVAQKLGLSIGAVYYKAKRGEIKSYRRGKRWLFKPEDVEAMSREYTPTPYVPEEVTE